MGKMDLNEKLGSLLNEGLVLALRKSCMNLNMAANPAAAVFYLTSEM